MDTPATPFLLLPTYPAQFEKELRHTPLDVLTLMAQTNADAVQIKAHGKRLVLLTAPELAHSVFVTHAENVTPMPLTRSMQAFWKRKTWFARADVQKATECLNKTLPALLKDGGVPPPMPIPSATTLEVTTLVNAWTLQAMVLLFFGTTAPSPRHLLLLDEALAVLEHAGPLQAPFPSPISMLGHPRLRKGRRQLETQIQAFLTRDSPSGQPSGLWHHLAEEGAPDLCVAVFVLTYAMILHTASFALLLTARHANLQTRLRAEITTLLATTPPDVDTLNLLPFTRRWIDETLRLFPPVWGTPWRVTDTFQAEAWVFKKKQVVLFSPYFLHRDIHTWPGATAFEPDRFSSPLPLSEMAYVPFAHLPLGTALAPLIRTMSALFLAATVQQTVVHPQELLSSDAHGGMVLQSMPHRLSIKPYPI